MLQRNGVEVPIYDNSADGHYVQTDPLTGEQIETFSILNGNYHGPRYSKNSSQTDFNNYKHGKLNGAQVCHSSNGSITTMFYIDTILVSLCTTRRNESSITLFEKDLETGSSYQTSHYIYGDGSRISIYSKNDRVVLSRTIYVDSDNLHRYEIDQYTGYQLRVDMADIYSRLLITSSNKCVTFDRFGFLS